MQIEHQIDRRHCQAKVVFLWRHTEARLQSANRICERRLAPWLHFPTTWFIMKRHSKIAWALCVPREKKKFSLNWESGLVPIKKSQPTGSVSNLSVGPIKTYRILMMQHFVLCHIIMQFLPNSSFHSTFF